MKLTEAKLKQLIKEVMTEAAKGIADIPDGVYVYIEKHPSEDAFTIQYVDEENKSARKKFGFKGVVVINEPQLVEEYPCEGALMVSWSSAWRSQHLKQEALSPTELRLVISIAMVQLAEPKKSGSII